MLRLYSVRARCMNGALLGKILTGEIRSTWRKMWTDLGMKLGL